MVEKFVNDVITDLAGKLSDQDLIMVQKVLQIKVANYDIIEKETAVVPYMGYVPECYKIFMVSKKIEGKSDKTLKLYKLYLDDFFMSIQKPFEKITLNDIKIYLYKVQQERHISNRTLDSRRSTLSSFFSWASAEQYIERNPMMSIKPIKYTSEERKPLVDMELELVRNACNDIREQAMVEFLYSTGCRVTEMEQVNISDVNFTDQTVRLFGKGSKYRQSFLTAKAFLLLQQYLKTRDDNNEALFVAKRSPHERMHKSGIEKVIKQIGDRAGIERLHPHLIRHTTATNALQHGMDVTQVQQLLGHANIATTMIYAQIDKDDLKRNHKKCLA